MSSPTASASQAALIASQAPKRLKELESSSRVVTSNPVFMALAYNWDLFMSDSWDSDDVVKRYIQGHEGLVSTLRRREAGVSYYNDAVLCSAGQALCAVMKHPSLPKSRAAGPITDALRPYLVLDKLILTRREDLPSNANRKQVVEPVPSEMYRKLNDTFQKTFDRSLITVVQQDPSIFSGGKRREEVEGENIPLLGGSADNAGGVVTAGGSDDGQETWDKLFRWGIISQKQVDSSNVVVRLVHMAIAVKFTLQHHFDFKRMDEHAVKLYDDYASANPLPGVNKEQLTQMLESGVGWLNMALTTSLQDALLFVWNKQPAPAVLLSVGLRTRACPSIPKEFWALEKILWTYLFEVADMRKLMPFGQYLDRATGSIGGFEAARRGSECKLWIVPPFVPKGLVEGGKAATKGKKSKRKTDDDGHDQAAPTKRLRITMNTTGEGESEIVAENNDHRPQKRVRAPVSGSEEGELERFNGEDDGPPQKRLRASAVEPQEGERGPDTGMEDVILQANLGASTDGQNREGSEEDGHGRPPGLHPAHVGIQEANNTVHPSMLELSSLADTTSSPLLSAPYLLSPSFGTFEPQGSPSLTCGAMLFEDLPLPLVPYDDQSEWNAPVPYDNESEWNAPLNSSSCAPKDGDSRPRGVDGALGDLEEIAPPTRKVGLGEDVMDQSSEADKAEVSNTFVRRAEITPSRDSQVSDSDSHSDSDSDSDTDSDFDTKSNVSRPSLSKKPVISHSGSDTASHSENDSDANSNSNKTPPSLSKATIPSPMSSALELTDSEEDLPKPPTKWHVTAHRRKNNPGVLSPSLPSVGSRGSSERTAVDKALIPCPSDSEGEEEQPKRTRPETRQRKDKNPAGSTDDKETAGRNGKKPPAKPKEPPAKSKQPPVKSKQQPAKSKPPPAKSKEPPAKANAPPAKSKQPPAKPEDVEAKAESSDQESGEESEGPKFLAGTYDDPLDVDAFWANRALWATERILEIVDPPKKKVRFLNLTPPGRSNITVPVWNKKDYKQLTELAKSVNNPDDALANELVKVFADLQDFNNMELDDLLQDHADRCIHVKAQRQCVSVEVLEDVLGKYRKCEVQDLWFRKPPKVNSPMSIGTFAKIHEIIDQQPSRPVNALNNPSALVPLSIPRLRELSFRDSVWQFTRIIEHPRYDESIPMNDFRWTLLSTRNAYSVPHVDANGMCTIVNSINCTKLWWVGKREEFDVAKLNAFDDFGPYETPIAKYKWVPVWLEPGDILIMRPGTPHAVLTIEPGYTVGEHFWSMATLERSIYTLFHTLFAHRFITNASHDLAVIKTLCRFMHCWAVRLGHSSADKDIPSLDFTSNSDVKCLVMIGTYLHLCSYLRPAGEKPTPRDVEQLKAAGEDYRYLSGYLVSNYSATGLEFPHGSTTYNWSKAPRLPRNARKNVSAQEKKESGTGGSEDVDVIDAEDRDNDVVFCNRDLRDRLIRNGEMWLVAQLWVRYQEKREIFNEDKHIPKQLDDALVKLLKFFHVERGWFRQLTNWFLAKEERVRKNYNESSFDGWVCWDTVHIRPASVAAKKTAFKVVAKAAAQAAQVMAAEKAAKEAKQLSIDM